jgi:predicted ester cyclase
MKMTRAGIMFSAGSGDRVGRRTLGKVGLTGMATLGLGGVGLAAHGASAQGATPVVGADELEANKAMVRVIYATFSGGDPNDLNAVVAEDFAHHPRSPGEAPNREGFKSVVGVFRSIFPDFDVTLEDVVAEGDRVAIRGIARGTHEGDLLGIPGTGVAVEFGVADVYQITDGLIAAGWHQEDYLSIFQQIGAYPPLDESGSTPTT